MKLVLNLPQFRVGPTKKEVVIRNVCRDKLMSALALAQVNNARWSQSASKRMSRKTSMKFLHLSA